MVDRIFVVIEVAHRNDGDVDEIDVVSAMRAMIPHLQKSAENRHPEAEVLISNGEYIGGESSGKHYRSLVITPDVLSTLLEQMMILEKTAPIIMAGQDLGDLVRSAIEHGAFSEVPPGEDDEDDDE